MNENLILRKANKSYHYGYYKGIYFELANIAFTNKWFWLIIGIPVGCGFIALIILLSLQVH